MFQVRIHGRGGQGVVSGAEMLSVAAFVEGRFAQLFPLRLGTDGRAGHGVLPYRRKGIRLREPVLEPDAVIIQDPTLLHQVDCSRPARPRLHPDQLDAQLRGSGTGRFHARFQSPPPMQCAGDRDCDEARRARGAECASARASRGQRPNQDRVGRGCDRERFHRRSRKRTSPRRPKPMRSSNQPGNRRCLNRSKGLAR